MGRRIPLALVLVLFVGVAACSDDSTGTETTSETGATEAFFAICRYTNLCCSEAKIKGRNPGSTLGETGASSLPITQLATPVQRGSRELAMERRVTAMHQSFGGANPRATS